MNRASTFSRSNHLGRRLIKATAVSPDSIQATTGFASWWDFQTKDLPGVGAYSVNSANGNLIVQSVDMDIAHKGIPLSFVRTYNSQSHHDAAGSDGSQPSLFGNG